MSRRLLGPVGGPVVFFLIAALVFAGLGWATVVALRVERAQREAAAQAELGNALRDALWHLDGRMLLPLGVEDSRPFHHYASADPLSGSTTAPTPLLAAPLPDWMKLHVQLDPATGWTSPQVLSPDALARVSEAWPDLPLLNTTAERGAVLAALNDKYPAPGTCEVLAARERAIPADAHSFAAPLFDPRAVPAGTVAAAPRTEAPPVPQPPAGMPPPAPVAPESFRIFGWELPCRDAVASNLPRNDSAGAPKDSPPVPPGAPENGLAPGAPPPAAPAPAVAGRGNVLSSDNDSQTQSFRNRSGTISRSVEEAKKAGRDFPMHGKAQGQMPPQSNWNNPLSNGSYNSGNSPNTLPGGLPVPGSASPVPLAANGPGTGPEKVERDTKDIKAGAAAGKPTGSGPDPVADRSKQNDEANKEKKDDLRTVPVGPYGGSFLEHLAGSGLQVPDASRKPPTGPRAASPWDERALSNTQNLTNGFLWNTAIATVPPAVNIHLGSMRPQWMVAADGTETLALVRAARIDQKTVYQGVILDWAKLEQVLKEEVKYVFPGASLVPVKDAVGVPLDRAMTALPVQLDPGPPPELPPAGWTPLRFGLALAWVAALVAFAAVGLSGWSLVDLAERRIRFVSAVTHELRTPLTSFRLYIDLLLSGMIQDEAKRREYLNTLATESDRLHRLIDNVLDFAKLERRRANGDMKPVKVSALLDQLRTTWTDRVGADAKELVVISTLPADLDVCTDAAMVQQIVGNLIDNARKYTRDAADKRIWLWAKPGGSGRVVFEVEDRGSGVPAGERKSIFKPFRRGAHADTRAGGAGLGLALAKQWAEVLGGTVAYRTADGAPGSCFRLELPVK